MKSRCLFIACCYALLLSGCQSWVYRPDVQQGNIIDPAAFHQIAVGQSPAAVIKLLGTPLIRDPVHNNRWDYVAYYQTGHFEQPTRQDFTVFFKDGVVSSYELISR